MEIGVPVKIFVSQSVLDGWAKVNGRRFRAAKEYAGR